MKTNYLLILLLIAFGCSTKQSNNLKFKSSNFEIALNNLGQVVYFGNQIKNYAVQDQQAALIALKLKDQDIVPQKVDYNKEQGQLNFVFPNAIEVVVKVQEKESHVAFEVLSVSNENEIDALIWGPYHTTVTQSIGETLGIVQDDTFTFGIQVLNLKTLGGYPWNDNDHLPQLDIFSQQDPDNLVKDKGTIFSLYSVEAAKPTKTGSSLQAYTRNRAQPRVVKNVRHERFVSPKIEDGGLVGSKIALFGSETPKALQTIEKIELAEGLPHPTIQGEWVKTAPIKNASYLIMDFTEATIDQCVDYTKKAGFKYLYHGHPFASWGHFPLLKDQFPNGYQGMKNCVDKAESQGIYLGTHMLTNFINTHDAYITPVPDKRLAIVGSSTIKQDVDSKQTTIEIAEPDFFNQYDNNHLRSVVIGDEIIRYEKVSETAPWTLLNCTRGAFGTKVASYKAGSTIKKLADHGYKVFLGNTELNKEIAENMADFMNETGVRMLDFDGLEGAGDANATGNYGELLFADAWHKRLNDNLKNHFVLGASRPGHYFWHLYSRMNWGEPWYAGFRESQTDYRLRNQAYYKRNLMPAMLGWFRMTSTTTIEDIEWLMTRSAAYNAGFAFTTSLKSIAENGQTEAIFSIMNNWETARLQGYFTPEQQQRMQDISTEFQLRKDANNQLVLTEIASFKFEHLIKVRQPGEPLYSTFNFENEGEEQEMMYIITAESATASNLEMELDNFKKISLNTALNAGDVLKYTGGDTAIVYDKTWHKLKEIKVNASDFKVGKGKHVLQFDCKSNDGNEHSKLKIEVRLKKK